MPVAAANWCGLAPTTGASVAMAVAPQIAVPLVSKEVSTRSLRISRANAHPKRSVVST